jgi:hypothetical protein
MSRKQRKTKMVEPMNMARLLLLDSPILQSHRNVFQDSQFSSFVREPRYTRDSISSEGIPSSMAASSDNGSQMTRMNMRENIWKVICLLVLLSQYGCKHNPVDPPPKNSREYEWTVETLTLPGNWIMMLSIWGSSEKDVYVSGFSTQGTGRMWHYDGNIWQRVALRYSEGGPFISMGALSDMYGFASNDIFAVGDKGGASPSDFASFIIHFNGSGWSEQSVPIGEPLRRVWGSGPHDVWSGGNGGSLFHYDGSRWTKFAMDTIVSCTSLTGRGPNEVYMLGYKYNYPIASNYSVLYKYDGTSWNPIDSTGGPPFSRFGDNAVTMVDTVLYTIADGVFARRSGQWKKELTASDYLTRMAASSSMNIFAVGYRSLIYHYNGTDWKQLTNIINTNCILTGVWCTEREAFIVGRRDSVSIVLHGK